MESRFWYHALSLAIAAAVALGTSSAWEAVSK